MSEAVGDGPDLSLYPFAEVFPVTDGTIITEENFMSEFGNIIGNLISAIIGNFYEGEGFVDDPEARREMADVCDRMARAVEIALDRYGQFVDKFEIREPLMAFLDVLHKKDFAAVMRLYRERFQERFMRECGVGPVGVENS